jgi:hypothetical protein
MKSRIQLAGVAHGSQEKVIWKGELPQFAGIPGMRFVLYTPPGEELGDRITETVNAYTFKQICFEINTKTEEIEQVIYVINVDRSAKELTE